MRVPDWIIELFEALDSGNVDDFCSYLTEDASFIYASSPPTEGREAIHDFVQGFVNSIESSEHHLDEVYSTPGRVIVRGHVDYERHDETTLEDVPFVDIFELEDGKIDVYQVYVEQDL